MPAAPQSRVVRRAIGGLSAAVVTAVAPDRRADTPASIDSCPGYLTCSRATMLGWTLQ